MSEMLEPTRLPIKNLINVVSSRRRGMKVIAQDKDPGIEDVDRVLAGGHTTSNGLGMGVSGSKNIMDEFEIQTMLGAGTTIRTAKWLD